MIPNAFPEYESPVAGGDRLYPGMTLRDYFAGHVIASTAMAMNGNHHIDTSDRADRLAKQAYLLADAMLKAREAQP